MKTSGPLSRFLALIVDLALGHTLFYYLLSFGSFRPLYERFEDYFLALTDNKIGVIGLLLMVFWLAVVIRFYSTLLLGVSLGQWLCGIRSKGKWHWVRLAGAARVFLEAVSMPLLFLDLPALIGKQTVGEMLTFTTLVDGRKKMGGLFKLIGVPIVVILSLFAPLLQNLTLIDGLIVSFSSEKVVRLKKNADFKDYKTYPSNRFRFKTFSSLADGRFVILPSFEVTKKNDKKIILPYFVVYDKKNNSDGHFKIAKKFNLFPLLEQGKRGNPLFKAAYPELNKILGENRAQYERVEYSQIYEKKTLVNPLGQDQIEQLIQDSFELSYARMWKHIIFRGPFVKGYVEVRNGLLSLVRPGAIPEVDITELGDHKFLRFKQTFDLHGEHEKEHIESLIPIGTNNSLVFEFAWNKDMKSALSRKEFKENFLATANWFFDYKDVFPFPEKEEEMTPFHIIDFFTRGDLDEQKRELLEGYVFHLNYDVARLALEEDNKKLQELIISGLNRLFMISSIRNDLKKKYYSRRFLQQIKSLKRALAIGDKSFFNI